MELKITNKGEYISEAFGWKEKTFEALDSSMTTFTKDLVVKALDIKKDVELSKIDLLTKFLASKEYKKLNIKLENANDYFLMGYLFSCVQRKVDSVIKKMTVKHLLGHVLEEL